MPIKTPVHPGALVKANLDELKLTTAEGAKALCITRQQLHNVVSRKSAVSPEMAVRFEKAFGGSAGLWLRMQAAYDLAAIRRRVKSIKVRRIPLPKGDEQANA